MAYPSLEKYNQAFTAHSQLLEDPELRAGTLAKSGLGMPLAISGGFALTYTITSGGQKFAVRCFHRESKGLERRYVAVSKKLAALGSEYFLRFQFQPKGIRVDGVAYPVVKMAWAKGSTLGEFLEDNRKNAPALGRLVDSLGMLADFLQREGIAHGDLQSGNLMVSPDGSKVQLIDYDGMFVDEIKDLGSAELGHVNFQHPQRKSLNPFDAHLDRFSLISLSVAIKAMQAEPAIWDKTASEADAIVFRANDFLDPGSSPAFALLAKNSALTTHAKNFAAICKSPMSKTPTLADFLAGKNIPAASIVIAAPSSGSATSQGRPGYVGAYTVLSALDYAACLRAVGDKVEVVGQIVEVKQASTKGGKPYVFVNFGHWKGNIFKVTLWSDGLAMVKAKPDSTWVGRWVSVVGLMEPPFVNHKFNYSHLSITVGPSAQMTVISEQEARWRIAGAGNKAKSFSGSTNQDALDRIKGTSPASRPPSAAPARPAPPPASPASPNAAVLAKIRASTGSTPAGSPPAAGHRYQPPPQQPGVVERLVKWLFG